MTLYYCRPKFYCHIFVLRLCKHGMQSASMTEAEDDLLDVVDSHAAIRRNVDEDVMSNAAKRTETQLQPRKPTFVQRMASLFLLRLHNIFVRPLGGHMDTSR